MKLQKYNNKLVVEYKDGRRFIVKEVSYLNKRTLIAYWHYDRKLMSAIFTNGVATATTFHRYFKVIGEEYRPVSVISEEV